MTAVALQALEIFGVTDERLNTEGEAKAANNEVRAKVDDLSNRLKGLDQKVRSLQSDRSARYGKSVEVTNSVILRVAPWYTRTSSRPWQGRSNRGAYELHNYPR